MKTMKALLVPVDFSAVTEEVIATAVAFARAFGAKVHLLHVVQPPMVATAEYALPVEVVQEAMLASEKGATGKLANYVERFRAASVTAEGKILTGVPVPLILEAATELKADFILMGSHGHGQLYDFLVGSTASGVIKKARCGVVILPPPDKHK